MRIAAITDDGTTISRHFGRAPFYAVLTVQNDQVVNRDMRDKVGHRQFVHNDGSIDDQARDGFDPDSQSRHAAMASTISDCDVLLCRGMGWGAHQSMREHGIPTIVTDIVNIDDAVQAYLNGTIIDRPRGCSERSRRKGREAA